MAKTLLTLSFGVLIGAAAGALGTKFIYGKNLERVDPTPRVSCPPCPTCEAPEPDEKPVDLAILEQAPDLPVAEGSLPGLPLAAIESVGKAVDAAVLPCVATLTRSLVLDLTVTATGGQARVRKADVRGFQDTCDGGVCPETCVQDAAKTAVAPWNQDGESKVVWVVRGDHSP